MSRSGTRLRRSTSEITRGGVDTTNPTKQASNKSRLYFSLMSAGNLARASTGGSIGGVYA